MTTDSKDAQAQLRRDIEAYARGGLPSPHEMMLAPRLENWEASVWRMGKEFSLFVTGEDAEQPSLRDGNNTHTSSVRWFDRKNRFVRTRNMLYALGKPADAKQGSDA